jgi:hypothetical protein
VLSGFAKSPYGLLVQFINIEVSAPTTPEVTAASTPAPPVYVPPPVAPNVAQDQAFRSRYGIGEGDSMRSRYGASKFPGPAPAPAQPQPQPVYPVATAPAKTGLPTVIDEKQLKVTIVLNIVKLIAPASSAAPAPARPPR